MYKIKLNDEEFNFDDFICAIRIVDMGDEVTTQDGMTHIEGRKKKRFITIKKKDIESNELAKILQNIFSKIFTSITYIDTLSNLEETREFILKNDPTSQVKIWKSNLEYYEETTFQFLERGAEW